MSSPHFLMPYISSSIIFLPFENGIKLIIFQKSIGQVVE
jgi:hypothetical protein